MMIRPFLGLLAVTALLAMPAMAQNQPQTLSDILNGYPAEDWRTLDPENVLVMDLPSGPIYIEMYPELAPSHVERMKTLTRQGFYDGIVFHRVIDGFMAQGGDPTATGTGGSDLPDIQGEFYYNANEKSHLATFIGRDDRAARLGFVGNVPVATQAPTLPSFLKNDQYAMWPLHCRGVMSMARAGGQPNSANSQFFLMFGDSRDNLDQSYSVWGRVVTGYQNARRIARGEPPTRPTPIVRMRVLADVPQDERSNVEVLKTSSDSFKDYLEKTRQITDNGYMPNMCGIEVPTRIDGELKL